MERNLLLTISYDGTAFSGWQRQPSQSTVQGEVERALSVLCAKPVTVDGCSRTDAGVHALGQRATLRGDFAIPTENIRYAMNNLLPGSIRIRRVEEKPEGFHARFDCIGKTYLYRIMNADKRDPFERNYAYSVRRPLDVDAMRKAAAYVEGTHDFVCFQAAGGQERETTVRTITSLEIATREVELFSELGFAAPDFVSEEGAAADAERESLSAKEIVLSVTGDGFLYNMVRIIAGTLVDVGLGRISPEQVREILSGKDRTKAGHTAPARGLYLAEIYYEGELAEHGHVR